MPVGKSAADNKEIRSGGVCRDLGSEALPHWELADKYKIIDFELGVKITGAGFPVYRGKGARLQRALINFFLDENQKAGYEEVLPPLVVNQDSGYGTGHVITSYSIHYTKLYDLLNQEFTKEAKKTVRQYLQENDKDLTVTSFLRYSLNA